MLLSMILAPYSDSAGATAVKKLPSDAWASLPEAAKMTALDLS